MVNPGAPDKIFKTTRSNKVSDIMPQITLKSKNKTLGDYQLQKGISLTIGRRKKNKVIINDMAVSGHHAKIDSVGDGFVLIDLQSKNGSFVNDQFINIAL